MSEKREAKIRESLPRLFITVCVIDQHISSIKYVDKYVFAAYLMLGCLGETILLV